ncbi:biotin--[acetyl-CoA-carboxylase] ligase [Lampropedia aestuarii]|uniref:biotin--[biotin carboxyl-carrier protein] ligase n=1 Tax=Lampropedia aestuarii TaxID=2562762 RepID=A0A4S5BMB3_9BURK|nr:biotin--[acetyl-CoA-carboxylase] ligase [Lampropedia aestuarii]THJ33419.1 biotin--[acetyl-CoA-carboxylase] ligase [Lampropedia aestuarii]
MPALTATTPQSPWDLPALSHCAQAAWPGIALQWLASIDSTNSELMRRAANGQQQPCVLLAQEQTAGKGRLGKPWHMQSGQALALSIGLPLAPRDWSGLSLVVGLAVVSALSQWARQAGAAPEHMAAQRLGLKWPNDVWLMGADGQGQKMAGILIETVSHAAAVMAAPQSAASAARYVVIGMGLNLKPQDLQDTSVPPANVQDWAGVAVNPQDLLAHLIAAVLPAVQQFEREGFAAYQSAFSAWDLLAGRAVRLSDGRVGDCLGVDAQGELLLALDGEVVQITSGEVSVRPLPGAGGDHTVKGV